MTAIYDDVLRLDGAPLEGENPLPMFRSRPTDTEVLFKESLPEELRRGFGENTARRVLPYRMQDRYSRNKRPMELRLIVLENDRLKASFVPELGGRLWSLKHKETGRELLSRNPVFQPANLANRSAWFSGGIEWNFGYVGHACHTCSPVFAARVEAGGESFLRLYDFERMTGMFWQIDFHLPDGSDALYAHVKIHNPNKVDSHTYWWTNTAVPETERTRVFASADDVIYIHFGAAGRRAAYGLAPMPVLPSLPGRDFSYPSASDFANEYFFQCPESPSYWEAVVHENGELFFDRSTAPLRYRKMFCWGRHAGGRHWQEFLARPGTAYLEVQAGLAPTQMHGLKIPAETAWEWTQLFAGGSADAAAAHGSNWITARGAVEDVLNTIVPETVLLRRDEVYSRYTSQEPAEILCAGSGWGELELLRMESCGGKRPEGFVFGRETLGELQMPWLALLRDGVLPAGDPALMPQAWMTQPEWHELLRGSLNKPGGRSWLSLLHAGNMLYEAGEEEEAVAAWRESASLAPSVVALRNLSMAADRKGNLEEAVGWMEKAWQLPEAVGDQSLAEEYINQLTRLNRYEDAWRAFERLPAAASGERIRLEVARAAMALGNLDYIESLFSHEYAVIREGETILTDLWQQIHALRIARERGTDVTAELLREAIELNPPPPNIDFRLVGYTV